VLTETLLLLRSALMTGSSSQLTVVDHYSAAATSLFVSVLDIIDA